MQLHYNSRKATQAAAYLVSLSGGSMDLWTMLKLIYLFDRASLVETGASITGDSLDCMPFGPTPSRIYDNTKVDRDQRGKDSVWREYLTENVNNQIKLQNMDFKTDELSQLDRDLIRQTWETHGKKPFKELFDFVHKLPEYKDPEGSSSPIEPEDILKDAKWTEEEIRDACSNANRIALLNMCK